MASRCGTALVVIHLNYLLLLPLSLKMLLFGVMVADSLTLDLIILLRLRYAVLVEVDKNV